jgi:CDP-ribitol ribitolphosphotransferase
MSIIIKLAIAILNGIFFFMKLLPVQKKITYISRQSNKTPIDFELVKEDIKKQAPEYKHVILAKRIPDHMMGKIKYAFHVFVQMYHIATSEAVLLDTYCIPISILKQRHSLVVIQMWHALGAFKKFAYSILDQKEGSSSRIAQLMKMHYHYSYVLTSSHKALPFFAEAFNVEKEKMVVLPLPRTDLLIEEGEGVIERIEEAYPQLQDHDKKVIVYAPTFRKSDDHLRDAILSLINEIDHSKYHLVLKLHPLIERTFDDQRIIVDHKFSTQEFFHRADIIVTDYSAALFEACMMNKPIYFYDFDYDTYMRNRSFYLDYKTDMPGPLCETSESLMNAIEMNTCDLKRVEAFRKEMVAPCKESYTRDFTSFLLKQLSRD